MHQSPHCPRKIRSQADLQSRISFLQQRLAKVQANPSLTDATKAVVERFELETIRNLEKLCNAPARFESRANVA